ncbi:MAG: hypothetical protein HY913_06240 [Desulfomonile tiedjei]|nr:hypothetical protein [Desulfomonile tiedjei]
MRSAYIRSRWLLWVLPLLLITTLATSAGAQGLFGMGSPGEAFLGSVPGFASFDVAGMVLTPNVRAGHQWIGLNFNLPTASAIPFFGASTPIDIQLRDAHVWVGSVGLEGWLTPAFSLFVNAEGNAKRSVGAVTSEEPLHVVAGGLFPSRWDASHLEWWAVEGGFAYRISNSLAVFAALRREHLSFGLDNPRDQFGNPINSVLSPAPGIVITNTAGADFQLKLWTPYLGVRFMGPNYRCSLSWTPFVSAAVKVPDHFVNNLFVGAILLTTGIEWNYSMFRTGAQLEGDFEYDMKLSPNFSLKAWAKGSWLSVRGRGNLDEILNNALVVGGVTLASASFAGAADETATLTRSQVAVGLGAELNF